MAGVTLLAGLLLPWLAGMTALVLLRGKRPFSAPGEIAWIAGAGYLVGAFVLTLWMRLLSTAGVGFSALSIAAPLLAATAIAGYLAWRRAGAELWNAIRAAGRAAVSPPGLDGATLLAWRALLAWTGLRFLLLGAAVAWQPLFPWDAWTQWATKARVWFELGRIVPFASVDAWFAADGAAYFDAAPGNPPTMPLLQVWACIALGRWDDTLMNWPWWQIAVALAAAVYGAMRMHELPPLAALVVAFFVASLPLANVHVALAGYADLPLAAYYTCAVLASLRWIATRDLRDAALAVVLAWACTQIANAGFVWVATLIPGAIVVFLPARGLKIATAGLAAILFLLAVLAQTSPTLLGYRLHLDFDPAWSALFDSYFLLGSWNLLWYGVLGVTLLSWRELASRSLAPLTTVVAAGAIVLFVVVAFPAARVMLAEQMTLHRATLHFAPLLVVFAALAFRAFALRWAATQADADASAI
jgi:hypothetical protein